MSLVHLAGIAAHAFADAKADADARLVQSVKDAQVRDVVTQLDIRLHELASDYVRSLDAVELLSEEDLDPRFDPLRLQAGAWVVVDPLDGSSNYALGMPGFGFMAARLDDARVTAAVAVLPEHDVFVHWTPDLGTQFSRSIERTQQTRSASVYYAYPPKLQHDQLARRTALLDAIDVHSAGVMRYGSACAGLFNLLLGRHLGFVGHEIRLWDALAFMPILRDQGFLIDYRISGLRISLVASQHEGFLSAASDILADAGRPLTGFETDGELVLA